MKTALICTNCSKDCHGLTVKSNEQMHHRFHQTFFIIFIQKTQSKNFIFKSKIWCLLKLYNLQFPGHYNTFLDDVCKNCKYIHVEKKYWGIKSCKYMLSIFYVIVFRIDNTVFVTIMCCNDELRSTMSWAFCLTCRK